MSNEVIQAYKDNQDHRILKVHLFDDSINVHGWGIDKELAASLAKEYEAETPYIIPPNLNHPVRPYAPLTDPLADIEDIKRYARPFQAGHCFKTEPCVSNHSRFGFDGYIKLTHPRAIEAFDRGLIPKYSSIALYDLTGERTAGFVKKAQALNICAVAKPAYPNAELLGSCKGNEVVCHSNLKNAGIETDSNYCILKTLENNDYDKFQSKVNTSLNSESELVASYNIMSQATTTGQPVNNSNVVQPQNSIPSPTAAANQPTSTTNPSNPVIPQTGVTNAYVPQIQQPQPLQQPQQIQRPEDKEAKEQINEILDYKKLYEELLPQSEHKDALLVELQKRINKYEKDQDALKVKEIERFVTIDVFNGDSKVHAQKVKEWKERAEIMTLDDLTYFLTESYGRKVYGEKKAGLQYEPTAVLQNGNVPQSKKFSIYEIGSLDLSKGGAY